MNDTQRISDAAFQLSLTRRGQNTAKALIDLLDSGPLTKEDLKALCLLLDRSIHGDSGAVVKSEIQNALIKTIRTGN